MIGPGGQPRVDGRCKGVFGLAEKLIEATKSPQERDARQADRNQGNRPVRELAPEQQLDQRAYRGQQRYQPDRAEEEHVSLMNRSQLVVPSHSSADTREGRLTTHKGQRTFFVTTSTDQSRPR